MIAFAYAAEHYGTPQKAATVKRELESPAEDKVARPMALSRCKIKLEHKIQLEQGGQRGSAVTVQNDIEHVKGCAAQACFRCAYIKHKEVWEKQLGLGRDGINWIAARIIDGAWGLGCRVCAGAGQKGGVGGQTGNKFATFSVTSGQLSNLRRHQASEGHAKALASLGLGRATEEGAKCPSEDDFLKVLKHVLADGSLQEQGLCGGRWKLRRMIWALAEAKREMDRDFLRRCESIALYQDSRQQMLLVRYAGCTEDLVTRRGVLGHVHMVGSGNQAILQSMTKVLDTFVSRGLGLPGIASVPKLDMQLREHIQAKVELFGSDSAADELLAGRLARQPGSLLPNVLIVARDRTHGARRWGLA